MGKIDLYVPEGATPLIDIDGGVGAVTLHVPADAPVQVDVDGKLGSVTVPDGYERVRRGSDFIARSGTWQSPTFTAAEGQIIIRCNGGIGKLVVRAGPKPVII